MLNYTFSRREKTLLAVLALVLVIIAWFVLVYQRTTNEITRMDGEIAATQTEITSAMTRVAEMNKMQSIIDDYKAKGETPTPIPDYDNLQAVMAELNGLLSSTDTYSLAFDDLKSGSAGYVMRGVRATYSCGSREQSESIVEALANGPYPCSIDSVSINDASATGSRTAGNAPVSTTVHITYFERQQAQQQAQSQAQQQATGGATA